MKLFAEQVRTYVPTTAYWVLMASVVPTAVRTCVTTSKLMLLMSWLRMGELAKRGEIDKKVVADAIAKFNIDADKVNPRLA